MNTTRNYDAKDDEIDLLDLFKIVFDGKWVIVCFTSFFLIASAIYSLSLPNIYKSVALLAPVEVNDFQISNEVSGLASIAGIKSPFNSTESNLLKAIEKLSSLSFFEYNLMPNIFLPNLMAVRSWDSKKQKIIYDDSLYDESLGSWIRDFSYPQKQIPSAQESFEQFKKKHLTISQDKKTGFVTLTISHQSPVIAAEWAELVINEINLLFREKDKMKSEKASIFLNKQMLNTSVAQVKQAIAQLLQKETQKLTLIEANDFYVFEFIDPPSIREKKAEPNRLFICLIGAVLGLILGVASVLIKHFRSDRKLN